MPNKTPKSQDGFNINIPDWLVKQLSKPLDRSDPVGFLAEQESLIANAKSSGELTITATKLKRKRKR